MPNRLIIYYFSDVHGKYKHTSKFAYELKSKQKASPGLILFPGDFRGEYDPTDKEDVHGNLALDVLKNLLGTEGVAVLGNHDTFGGPAYSSTLLKKFNKPFLAANVVIPSDSPFAGTIIPEIIHKSQDGSQYVVLGITTADTTCKPHELTIQSIEDTANTLLAFIEKYYQAGQRNFIIASHLGLAGDKKVAEIITAALAAKKSHLDIVIVGGHSHDVTDKPVVIGNTDFSHAYIVQNAKFDDKNANLARLNLIFDNGKVVHIENTLFPVTADSLEKDPEVERLLAALMQLQEQMKKNVLTYVNGAISSLDWAMNDPKHYSRAGHLRVTDSLLMRKVADAMAKKADQIKFPVKHHAFLQAAWNRLNFVDNADGTLAPLTEYHINQADNFREYLVTMQLTGEQLYQALEQGAAKLNWHDAGGLIHVDDGIQYTYDASKEPGKRIMLITIDGLPIEKNKLYPIVTTRSLAQGLTDHPELETIPSVHHEDLRLHYIIRDEIKSQFSNTVFIEKFGERITCLFPGSKPETLMIDLENKVLTEKLPRSVQKPLTTDQLNFDEYLVRRKNFLDNQTSEVRDSVSTSAMVSNNFGFPPFSIEKSQVTVNPVIDSKPKESEMAGVIVSQPKF